ncbi:unnamed protein product [Nippostrongylus brasiliensis]|uniref:SCP domain-containing protein n=1 Tax=Nippostrongylus brasiliensis TaxID=27835 RepID=A0A158R244_NIPBR|nr:unnamed protein product [Nippostrongylus brasiliensis]
MAKCRKRHCYQSRIKGDPNSDDLSLSHTMAPPGRVPLIVVIVFNVAVGHEYHCNKDLIMNDDLRFNMLNYHNDIRTNIAWGAQDWPTGQGPAKNMYRVGWDCKLEEEAAKSLQQCSEAEYTAAPNNFAVLDVISKPRNKWPATNFALHRALNSWYKPSIGFDQGSTLADEKLGAFGNVRANKVGDTLYEDGWVCYSDSDCTTYENSRCSGGLCEAPDNLVLRTTTTTTTTTANPSAGGDGNSQCANNPEMTDEARKMLTDKHNQLRAQTAKGLSVDPKSATGFAPKGSAMKKMKYDCEIEASAQAYTNLCKGLQHSWGQYGENIWMIFAENYNRKDVVDWAPQSWFDELKQYGVGEKNIFNASMMNVGHYTQVVWGDTDRFGCGFKSCAGSGYTALICQYAPPGNWLDSTIYKVGEPCSACPVGTTCEDGALCA